MNPTLGKSSLRCMDATKGKWKEDDEVVDTILQIGEKHSRISENVRSFIGFKQALEESSRDHES